MKITFPCSRCGKTLKARESAGGRTRKCPVCATRVTCPEPLYDADVVDAEIVDAEVVAAAHPVAIGAGVNPYADLDDDGDYQVVDSGANADSETEARRPCPMCGETILAAAVKCRYCGEVFDAVLKKGKRRKSGKKASRRGSNPDAVRALGIGVVLTVIGIGLTAASFANPVATSGGQAKSYVFYGLIIGGIGGIIQGIRGFMSSD
jgi:DNA-directed RNA polymerase subunit M/transcription elongation factor TFIIS